MSSSAMLRSLRLIIAVFSFICLPTFNMSCSKTPEGGEPEIVFSFQEEPVHVRLYDDNGNNVVPQDGRQMVRSLNGNGDNIILEYTIEGQGDERYIEYYPSLPEVNDSIDIGDILTTVSVIDAIGNMVLVTSEYDVVEGVAFEDSDGNMYQECVIKHSRDYVHGREIEGVADILSFIGGDNGYWLVGNAVGDIDLYIVIPSTEIAEDMIHDGLFSLDVFAEGIPPKVVNDVSSTINNDGTIRVTFSIKSKVHDYFDESGLIEPRKLRYSVKCPLLFGDDEGLDIVLGWKGDSLNPKFEMVGINATPLEISIVKNGMVEYVRITL